MFYFILLIFALSIDTFLASLTYSVNQIKIPQKTAVIICLICSSMLTISLLFGKILTTLIPSFFINLISFLILIIIGTIKTFESSIQLYLKHHREKPTVQFSCFNFHFILSIYSDYQKADQDHSKSLSIQEAIPLSIALSMDALTAGLAVGTMHFSFLIVFLLCFIINLLFIELSIIYGKRIGEMIHFDFSLLSGILFFLLAFLRIL